MHESSVVRNISRPVETHGTLHMSSRFRNYARLLLALKRRERGTATVRRKLAALPWLEHFAVQAAERPLSLRRLHKNSPTVLCT